MNAGKLPPIQWLPGDGERTTKVNAIVTELVKQAIRQEIPGYHRDEVVKAIRAIADVGDPQTIDSYIEDICETEAVDPYTGTFYVTDAGKERFREARGA